MLILFIWLIQINLISKSSHESYEAMEEGSEAHWEVVQRILFLYAKLNPGLGYVQGMNEIIGPIYYVLASDPNVENRSKCLVFFAYKINDSYYYWAPLKPCKCSTFVY